jgi:hypothetical protein
MVSPEIMMQRNKPILATNFGDGKLFFPPCARRNVITINAAQQLVYFVETAYNGLTSNQRERRWMS